MEYKVITVDRNEVDDPQKRMNPDAINKLTSLVNEEIGKGWRPVGGIAYLSGIIISQAMIKRQ